MENLSDLIITSAELMVIGMGSVFVILTSLIFLITWTSKLLSGYADPEPALQRRSTSAIGKPAEGEDQELIAVISAAIKMFKQNKGR